MEGLDMSADEEGSGASGNQRGDRYRSDRTGLLRRQYRLTPAHISKLERLQSEQRFASASEALRHAINVYDPSVEPDLAEILPQFLEAWEREVAAAQAHIKAARAQLAWANDSTHVEAQRRAVRDETRRHYEGKPDELSAIASGLFGR